MQKFVALTCEALARSIYALSAQSDHTISIRLFRQGLHNRPKNLREVLQEQIDAIEPGECDAILLVYGICGTSTIGLSARHTPLVMPRAHDCITLYLGSRERYQEEFEKNPGTYWYSLDYMERQEDNAQIVLGAAGLEIEAAEYEKYIERYGKETADLLMEEMRRWSRHYSRAAFIDTGQGTPAANRRYEESAQQKASKEGWAYERLQGNQRLLRLLVSGDWPEDEFLIVQPGQTIRQTYHDDLIDSD
ncbi:MAG: DUF1638 domain-containing protein [Anaerolineaceae bacterium]|nr:MAG: DUF1638 domain-containing protein [Anaerolineaceae bacterium]